MRVLAIAAIVLGLSATPAAAETDGGQVPACVIVSKRDVSDAKARRRCDLPDGTVTHRQSRGRWIIWVAP